MKKILIILILNVLFLYLILLTLDYSIYKKDYNDFVKESNPVLVKIFNIAPYNIFGTNPQTRISKKGFNPNGEFRGDFGTEHKKSPIIMLGCSFAFGCCLSNKETFSYKLAEYTKRPVYNRGVSGWGFQHLYYLFNTEEFYKSIPQTPEYVLYIFIPDHMRRMRLWVDHTFSSGEYYHLELVGNKLVEPKSHFYLLYSSYIGKSICERYLQKNISPEKKEENLKLAEKIFVESWKSIKTHYPNVKFVILRYYGAMEPEQSWMDDEVFWNNLKKDGFIVLSTKDLTGRILNKPKDLAPDNLHPSAKAWDAILVPFAKELKL